MKRLIQIIGLIVLFSLSSYSQESSKKPYKILKGDAIPRSSLSLPDKTKAGSPERKRIFANRHKIRHPKKRKLLDTPKKVTPGEGGILIPEKMTLKGKVSKIKYSPPVDAQPFRMRENATRNIRYLNIDQGMSSLMITGLMKDSKGNLWVTTYGEGISRYDGRKFYHFNTENGLSHNVIRMMIEDSKGNFWWVTYGGGLQKYDGNNLTQYTTDDGLGHDRCRYVMEDSKGRIWVATDGGGVSVLDGDEVMTYNTSHGLSHNFVRRIIEDSKGNIWLSTAGGGFMMFDGTSFHYYTTKEGIAHDEGRDMYEDNEGKLWLCTYGGGISVLDGDWVYTYDTSSGLSSDKIWQIEKDSKNKLWISTYDGGVCSMDSEYFEWYKKEQGMTSNLAWSILIDDEDNVWVGTEGGGICKIVQHMYHFNTSEGLNHDLIYDITETSDGQIWMASLGGGVAKQEGDYLLHYTTDQGLPFNRVRQIEEDKTGNLWFATDGAGLVKYDGSYFYAFSTDQGVSGEIIWSVLVDSNENIWASTEKERGVSLIGEKEVTHFTSKNGLMSDNNGYLLEDKNGKIWIGSTQEGLTVISNDSIFFYTPENGLAGKIVLDIMESQNGDIWIGTYDGGISIWNGINFTNLNTADGLLSNTVWRIKEDGKGQIWVGTEKGLNVINSHSKGHQIHSITKDQGLKALDFRSLHIDGESQLWAGNGQSLTLIDLDLYVVQKSNNSPEIQLDHINVNQQFIDFRNDTTLRLNDHAFDIIHFANLPNKPVFDHTQNNITFSYSGLDWSNDEPVSYQYKLEGHDKDWQPITNSTSADYRNIPSGDYEFIVRSSWDEVLWSSESKYAFSVTPPFWKSSAAFIFYLLSLSFALYQLYKYQIHRARLRDQLAFEKKEAERLAEMDRIKSNFFANITHEFRTPLTLIMEPSRRLLKKIDPETQQNASLIQKNSKKLLGLVNELLDLSKIEDGQIDVFLKYGDLSNIIKQVFWRFLPLADEKGIELKYISPLESLMCCFDKNKIETVVTNLLSNALRYTMEGSVSLLLNHDEKSVIIQIADTGIGIGKDQLEYVFDRFYQVDGSSTRRVGGTGIGLSLSKELVRLMKGEIHVKSELSKGSTFTISLPLFLERGDLELLDEEEVLALGSTGTDNDKYSDALLTNDSDEKNIVLIVEDNIELRKFIVSSLEEQFQVIEASNGQEGIEKAQSLIPDVIVSDVMMPEKDGIELLDHLKNQELTSHVPVILLTAKSRIEHKLEGLSHGADDYLTKPFHTEELLIRMRNLIDLRMSLIQKYSSIKPEDLNNGSSTDSQNSDVIHSKLDQTFILKANRLIELHLSNLEWSIPDFAKELTISRTQLHRKLRALTGQSASEFIRNYRLDRAMSMLKNKEGRVSEIALEVGFGNEKYFSTSFKKRFGKSPSEV